MNNILKRLFFTNLSGKPIRKYYYLRNVGWFFLFMAVTSTYMAIALIHIDNTINIAGDIRLALYLLFLYSIPSSIFFFTRKKKK